MVTEVPARPVDGDKLEIIGEEDTVKDTALLFTPATVTATFPVLAPDGTVTVMAVALELDTLAVVPLKVTIFAPGVVLKPVPEIIALVPMAPDAGESPAI